MHRNGGILKEPRALSEKNNPTMQGSFCNAGLFPQSEPIYYKSLSAK